MITYKNRGGNLPSVRILGISTIPPGDPWRPVLAGNGVSTSLMDHASEHLTFCVPQFLIQASKKRATGASQHAEIQGCLGEPAGSEDQSSEQSVSQEPQYLWDSHCLSPEILHVHMP